MVSPGRTLVDPLLDVVEMLPVTVGASKRALKLVSALSVMLQGLVAPVHAPDQPTKVEPGGATALTLT
jgi:hypothetical protein